MRTVVEAFVEIRDELASRTLLDSLPTIYAGKTLLKSVWRDKYNDNKVFAQLLILTVLEDAGLRLKFNVETPGCKWLPVGDAFRAGHFVHALLKSLWELAQRYKDERFVWESEK
jgi:hypothetical protein